MAEFERDSDSTRQIGESSGSLVQQPGPERAVADVTGEAAAGREAPHAAVAARPPEPSPTGPEPAAPPAEASPDAQAAAGRPTVEAAGGAAALAVGGGWAPAAGETAPAEAAPPARESGPADAAGVQPPADDLDAWGNPDGVIPRALIDLDAVKILRRLRRHGHTAYLVGGGVRDLLLGRTPKDFDIGTSALPEEVRRLFRNCRIIGRRFRLAHVFFREKIIEVSTFRAVADPLADGRAAGAAAPAGPWLPGGPDRAARGDVAEEVDLLIRSDNVFGTAEEDALRRDFTINGLFYDVERGVVIDYVGGQQDLARRIIRTIGDPDIRFREDPIRMLRAIKFAARLGFTLDPATEGALRRHRYDIRRSAPPRVQEEVMRLLGGGAAAASFRLMADTEVLEVILPELQNLHRLAMEGNPIARYLWGCIEAHLEAIDAYDRGRRSVSNAALAGALAMPLLLDRPEGLPAWAPPAGPLAGAGPDEAGAADGRAARRRPLRGQRAQHAGVAGEIDGIVAALALRLNLARRDVDTLRAALFILWRMLHQPHGPRAGALARRPAFGEALVLLRLRNLACRGELGEEVARWEQVAASALPDAAGDEEAARGRRRRHRRRGGPPATPDRLPGQRPRPARGERATGQDPELEWIARRSAAAEAPVPTLLVGGPAAARAATEGGRFGAGYPPGRGAGPGDEARRGAPGRRRRRRRRGPRKPNGDDAPA